MADFISIPYEKLEAKFSVPRSREQSSTGLGEYVYNSVYTWNGTVEFAMVDSRSNSGNPLIDLILAELPEQGFFIDLPHPRKAFPENPAPPTWNYSPTNTSDEYNIIMQTGSTVARADYISFRISTLPEFVTTRIVRNVGTTIDGYPTAELHVPMPTEFLSTTSDGGRLQYCLDRPHARAVFEESPISISRKSTFLSKFPVLPWREDTLGNVNGIRAATAISPTLEDVILTNRNEPLLTNRNEYLEVNEG